MFRRQMLKGITAAGLTTLGAGVPAVAKKQKRTQKSKGKQTLRQVPLFFSVYAGRGENPDAFGFPEQPTAFRGFDRNGQVFDASNIEATPNGQTLHYGFRFLPNFELVGSPKPYVLTHEGNGTYEARGQNVNFEIGQRAPAPFSFLDAGKWRAVGKDIVQLTEGGGDVVSAATRVDFYDRDTGAYTLSLVYVLWAPGVGEDVVDPRNPQQQLPEAVEATAEALITDGQL